MKKNIKWKKIGIVPSHYAKSALFLTLILKMVVALETFHNARVIMEPQCIS